MQKIYLYICLFFSLLISLQAQNDAYYSTMNPNNPTFISELQSIIRSNYTRITYDQFDETNIANFASRDTTGGQRVVTCVYSGENYKYTPPFAWGTYSREHTWCHSWMPSYSSKTGNEYSDQHHLFPTNQNSANGVRSNHPLGVVSTVTSTFLLAKYGKNASNQNVYEPRDSHKGDAARALLYMCIRYNGVNGLDWTFNHLNTVTLPALNEAPEDLATLIQWHKADPPDQWEVERNDYIESIQGNRNPFVDHPEYVNYINFDDVSKLSPTYAAEPTNFPTGFTANSSSNSITLTWTDAIAGTQVPQGYFIEAYAKNAYFIPIDGSTYTVDTDLSDGRALVYVDYSAPDSYTFNNLVNGTSYFFKVYTYYGSGNSINYKIISTAPTATATILTGMTDEPLNHPTGLSTSNISSYTIQLNWVDAIGTPAPTGYLIKVNTTNVFTNPSDGIVYNDDIDFSDETGVINITFAGNNYYSFANLSPGTTYYFQIYSYAGTGLTRNYKIDGTIPNTSASTVSSSSQEPTNHVTNLSISDITASSFKVNWSDAVGAISPTGYLIQINTTNSFTLPTDGTVYPNDMDLSNNEGVVNINYSDVNYYSFTNLSPETTYFIKLFSYNGDGSLRNYKTDGVIPTINDTTLSAAIGDLFISEYVEGSATNKYIEVFNGTGVTIDLSDYKLQLYSNGAASPSAEITLTGNLQNNSTMVYKNSQSTIYGGEAITASSVINFNGNDAVALYKISTAGFIDIFGQIGVDPGTAWTATGGYTTVDKTLRRKYSVTHGVTTNPPSGFPTLGTEWDLYNKDDVSGLGSHTSALPVELNSFGGIFLNDKIQLSWQTATETNNYGFEIEKRSEYTNWETIGFVNGNGNSNVTNYYSFTDKQILPTDCYYRLKQIDNDGAYKYSETIKVASGITPDNFILYQNYPNPFNPSTLISYYVPQKSKVSLIVYDMLGKVITELVNEEKAPGLYSVNFESNNISSGVYFYTLQSGDFTKTNKMTLLR